MREEITKETLYAYVDGELNTSRRMEVEGYLTENPSAAQFIQDNLSLNHALHTLFDVYRDGPLPSEHANLGRQLEHQLDRKRLARSRTRLVAMAVGCACLGAVAVICWQQFAGNQGRQFLLAQFDREMSGAVSDKPATSSSSDVPRLAGLEETGALSEKPVTGTAEPQQARTGAPDFSKFGFRLIGTRNLPQGGDRSMQLIYEAGTGARIELFFGPESHSGKANMSLIEREPVTLLLWSNDGFSYSLIGEVERDNPAPDGQGGEPRLDTGRTATRNRGNVRPRRIRR